MAAGVGQVRRCTGVISAMHTLAKSVFMCKVNAKCKEMQIIFIAGIGSLKIPAHGVEGGRCAQLPFLGH